MERIGDYHIAELEIISMESPDTKTGQINFIAVTYRFWAVNLIT